jgi:hypothetical protein
MNMSYLSSSGSRGNQKAGMVLDLQPIGIKGFLFLAASPPPTPPIPCRRVEKKKNLFS